MSSYIDQLKQSMEEEKKMYEMAQAQQTATLNQQKDPIKEAANKLRGDTYTNSRLSAIGNNEALAQKGLAGGVYQEPRSGYSETSRIRQDTALRNSLNAADLDEAKKIAEIEAKIKDLGYDTSKQIAASNSKWNEKIAAAVREDELRRLQQEREDQLRREQWEREDRIRKEQQAFQRSMASYSRGSSSSSKSGTTRVEDLEKEYRDLLAQKTKEHKVLDATSMPDIRERQDRAYGEVLEQMKNNLSTDDYIKIAELLNVPEYLR